MIRAKTKDTTLHIEGPDDSGHYWLHLSSSGENCRIDLGVPRGMIETALLMAASVKFGCSKGDYTLSAPLQRIVEGAKTAPQWDTQADRLAPASGGVEATEDVGILRARVDELQRLNADLTRQVQMQPRRPQDAAPATDVVDALVKAAEEAAEVIHKAYVSATMEAVNAGPSHPLKDNIDKWRVRCLRAEEALRAALTTENQTNG